MNLRFKTSYFNKQDVKILNLDGNLSLPQHLVFKTFRVLIVDESFFVSFPQKRNSLVFSSGVNYLHSALDISNQSKFRNC